MSGHGLISATPPQPSNGRGRDLGDGSGRRADRLRFTRRRPGGGSGGLLLAGSGKAQCRDEAALFEIDLSLFHRAQHPSGIVLAHVQPQHIPIHVFHKDAEGIAPANHRA